MHDIRFIRDHPVDFDAAMKRRGLAPLSSDILATDSARRAIQGQLQDLQSRRNVASKEIGARKSKGEDADDLIAEVNEIKARMPELETEESSLASALDTHLMELPNILDDAVPDGSDEDDNALLRTVGTPVSFAFTPRDHVALGEALGQMDFTTAAKMSGARFVLLRGKLARLERALAAFMLDIHTGEFGYEEMLPPFLVNSSAMTGTGQLPKFGEDLFRADEKWLIPTAEVPLTNIASDEIWPGDSLPMRFTAHTPCFRSEAGAAGRDTRGMIRQHQFSKVELVSVTYPDESDAEHERMTACAEAVLQRLGLPYRVMILCSGDTGFGARKTYDIEVWLPGQDEGRGMYREISSCSNCGAFQARRMKARFRDADGNTQFVHTLNGSGLAVGRTMIAVLENGQQEDGSVRLPDVLHSYMGCSEITPA